MHERISDTATVLKTVAEGVLQAVVETLAKRRIDEIIAVIQKLENIIMSKQHRQQKVNT